MKYMPLAVLTALTVGLAGCGGGGGSNPLNLTPSSGYFRFVNGSADSGAVDVYVDGTKINTNPVAYGQMTAYDKFKAGSHTIAVDVAGTSTAVAGLSSTALTQSVNGAQYVSLVLVGEQHPTVGTDTPNLLAFTDELYDTPTGGAAVDYHNAAPVTGSATTQFGISSSTGTQNLGAALSVGGATQPTGIPTTFVGSNIAVTFTATPSNTAIPAATLMPSEVDSTGCATNTLPCNSANLSLYYIDGPAASTSPSTGPYPDGITASQTATFAGIFDANGT
jgi:hypothetical protein